MAVCVSAPGSLDLVSVTLARYALHLLLEPHSRVPNESSIRSSKPRHHQQLVFFLFLFFTTWTVDGQKSQRDLKPSLYSTPPFPHYNVEV